MCTHKTLHASCCNFILTRETNPCNHARISVPPTFPAAGPGYQGSSCPYFLKAKATIPESGAKCRRHSAAENPKMSGIQAPERLRSSSEPQGGTKDRKHTWGEKLNMNGIRAPERKGSGSESGRSIGGVTEAGLDFEFGLVGLRNSGSPPTRVERMASVAKRVRPGKVKEMVMKFNAVVEQEEDAKRVSEETARATSGESFRKAGGLGLEDQDANMDVTGALDLAEATKIDEEELEDTLGGILSTYHHDDISWKEGELRKHSDEVAEIFDYYYKGKGIEDAGDPEEKTWKLEETEIEIAQKSGQEDVAVEIKELEGQENMIETLDETVALIDMAAKAWWINETSGQDSITTKVEEAAHQDGSVTGITQSFCAEDNILKIGNKAAQALTDSGVDENFDRKHSSTYLDSRLDEDPLASDHVGLTVDVHANRFSTLVREYTMLVSPVSELDDPLDLPQEPSISPPLRQNSDLISPVTEFDTDSASSSRPVTPANLIDYYQFADLSPSTTPLLQRARTNGSLPTSHNSTASTVSAASGSSNYSDYSPSSPYHDQDTTQSTSLTTYSTSNSFRIPSSSFNTPSFTTSSTPFTPQTFSGYFDSFVEADSFAPLTTPLSFEEYIATLPEEFRMSPDLENRVEAMVQDAQGPDGVQSLLYVPADDTIWNWDGSRWVGQREDGSLILGDRFF